MIESQSYFVLHAPRQSGKTTALMALAADLTRSGAYAATVLSVEQGRPYRNDLALLEPALLDAWQLTCRLTLPPVAAPADWSRGGRQPHPTHGYPSGQLVGAAQGAAGARGD